MNSQIFSSLPFSDSDADSDSELDLVSASDLESESDSDFNCDVLGGDAKWYGRNPRRCPKFMYAPNAFIVPASMSVGKENISLNFATLNYFSQENVEFKGEIQTQVLPL